MTTIKKVLCLTVMSFVLLTACQNKSQSSEQKESETITIGSILPLTGNAASFGQDARRAIEYYLKENPSIDDKKIEVVFEDGKCNTQEANRAANKLITVDKVQVILGGFCSDETLGAATIAERAKVILLSPASSSPLVSQAGDYVFRIYPSDSLVSQTLAEYVLERHKNIALLAENTNYAGAYQESMVKFLNQKGVKPVFNETYIPDTTDFKVQLQKISESNADALVFLAQNPVSAGYLVRQAKELGVTASLYGADATNGKQFFDIAKDAAEGVKINQFSIDIENEAFKELREALSIEASATYAAMSYDTIQLIAESIMAVGNNSEKIKEHWYAMGETKGTFTRIAFDENGDNNLQGGSIFVAQDQTFVLEK